MKWNYAVDTPVYDHFVVLYRPVKSKIDFKEISGSISQFYKFQGLEPNTTYELSVLAVNVAGRGNRSHPVISATLPEGRTLFF